MKNPFKISRPRLGFDTLGAALKDSLKKPYIGVTQGGSSRRHKGARVAATTAEVRQGPHERRHPPTVTNVAEVKQPKET